MADTGSTISDDAPKWWRKGKPGRLKSSMVGLSTAAILGVYAAGYVSSSGAAGQEVFVSAATTATPAGSTPTATSTLVQGRRPSSVVTPAATATPAASATTPTTSVAYKDGVYSGTGTGPHGGMTVAVTVQGARIVSVEVTSCQTRWPCSRISEMPAKVLAAQSARVTYVSRATDSSVAFVRGVTAALEQARV